MGGVPNSRLDDGYLCPTFLLKESRLDNNNNDYGRRPGLGHFGHHRHVRFGQSGVGEVPPKGRNHAQVALHGHKWNQRRNEVAGLFARHSRPSVDGLGTQLLTTYTVKYIQLFGGVVCVFHARSSGHA